ncbi:MAG TPA: shikimate kinase [Tepidisphaeraceae bacterium]|jgi:shikimate kinase|nr:shikimate kinase [Tepidisphaeraceae bacterium]
MSVILIGYRGSGKTTTGAKLADRLWLSFVDVDELIVKKAGKTIREIFADEGEPHFRDLESAALKEALAKPDHVIALGGGSVVRPENREAIKASGRKVVYLRCDPEVLFQRIQADATTAETRPNLTSLGGSVDEIKKLMTEREPFYREVMTSELDVTNLSPEEACVYISRMM